jgi:hypothetical protein
MSQPPRHGKISVTSLPKVHAKKHLAAMTKSAGEVASYHRGVDENNETKDFGSHGIGYSSQGAFSAGGASGADYQTDSVGSNDCDAGSGSA